MKKTLFTLTIIALVIVLAASAIATSGFVQKNLLYDDIKITLDGREIKPTDVNGNYIEPFIIDGTTYLPVRGIASTLGLDVDWDGETSTVMLNAPKKNGTTLLIERDGISVSYKDYEYNEDGDLILNFYVENFSDNEVIVEAYDTSVNGYMLYCSLYETLPAGKKLNADVIFYADDLEENGIAYVENIELLFDVYNTDTFDSYVAPIIEITPEGATVTGEAELTYNPEPTVEKDDTYQEYVDFVKENGVYDEVYGLYDVSLSAPVQDLGTDSKLLSADLVLSYSEFDDYLALQVHYTAISESGDDMEYGIIIYLPGKSDVYNWYFYTMVGAEEIEMLGTWNVVTNGIDSLEITDGYEQIETLYESLAQMLLAAISIEGDMVFTEYGSDLSLSYFGI